MTPTPENRQRNELDDITRFLHLGLTVFGILAFVTGFFADDYKRLAHPGFSIHRWLGITLAFFMVWRIWLGFWGPKDVQFSQWLPYTKERLLMALEDIFTLVKFRLPLRPTHQGLSGVVQTFGLAVFSWMAFTGSLMFFFMSPGHKARGVLHLVKELHELGFWLIPIFLGLHAGAVSLHALAGEDLWRKTFFLKK
jgi:cytochrome b561